MIMMSRCPPKRIAITQLNQHLTCALCSGYLIDATTIVECLHSFCRACLLRYFETSDTCPICDTEINESQLDKSIRADRSLQDLVYKLIPGLYKSEFQRRKEFCMKYYEETSDANVSSSTAKDTAVAASKVLMQIFDHRLIELASRVFAPDDIIVFSLECRARSFSEVEKIDRRVSEGKQQQQSNDLQKQLSLKRYFRCPAAVKISHLKKMLRSKFDTIALWEFETFTYGKLPKCLEVVEECYSLLKVEILHVEDILPDNWALMDVATVHCWDRKSALKLHFELCKYKVEEEPMPKLVSEVEPINCPPMETGNIGKMEKLQKHSKNPIKFNIEKILTVESPETLCKTDVPTFNAHCSVGQSKATIEYLTSEKKFSREKACASPCQDSCNQNTSSIDNGPPCDVTEKDDSIFHLLSLDTRKRSNPPSPLSLIDRQLMLLTEKSVLIKDAENLLKPVKPKAKKSLNIVVQRLATTTSMKDGSDLQSSAVIPNVQVTKSRSKKLSEPVAKIPRLIGTIPLMNGSTVVADDSYKKNRETVRKVRREKERDLEFSFVAGTPEPTIGSEFGTNLVGKTGLNLADLNLFTRPQNIETKTGAETSTHSVLSPSCNSQISCA